MKILIDADACPVKDIIVSTSRELNIEAVFVCSLSHYTKYYQSNDINPIYVDNVSQSADLAIINKAGSGDIVVTGDYGLAAVVLAKGAYAISFDGKLYNNDNIDGLLNRRHDTLKLLQSGRRIKGPKKRTTKDDDDFLDAFMRLIRENMT